MESATIQVLEELRRKNAVLNLLQQIAVAANASSSVEAAVQFAIERVCSFTGWPLGHAWLREEGTPPVLRSANLWHIETPERFEEFRRRTLEWQFEPGIGLPGRVLAQGTPAWISDVRRDSNFPRAALVENLGVASAFAFPVLIGQEVVAVLEFFAEEVTEPDEGLLDVMAQIGVQLGRVVERQRAEKALRASADRFRALTDSAIDAIVTANIDGLITDWNRGAEMIFGYSTEEAVGATLDILMPERYVDAHRKGMKRFSQTGEAHVIGKTVELHGRRKDGEEFPLELSLSRWHDGDAVFYTGIMRDVTERKTGEQAVLRLNAELRQRNEDLQHFAYVASHDLQEPLRKIRSFSTLLKEDYGAQIDATGLHYLTRIVDSGERMSRLLSDLLLFTRVSTQQRPFTEVPLDRVVGEVLSDLEMQLRDTEGRVEMGPLPVAKGDPTQMRQLFQNLIANALKFHRPGVPPVVRVEGSVEEQDGRTWCRLTVEDNGIGLDEKYAERIFVPFQRLHGQGEYAGTGMGLAICRRIVERHGGTITVHSGVGQGSTFEIKLPASG